MRIAKYGFMSPLMSPYKFVMVGDFFGNRYHRFHSESFSIALKPTKNDPNGWLSQVENGVASGEDYINGINWDFSQKGYINNEH